MAPFIALITIAGLARLGGWLGVATLDSWPIATAVGLAAMFTMTAISHFVQPRRAGLISIVPPQLPRPDLIITTTGLLEFAGALGLLIPTTRAAAAACLAILLIVMFPANIYASQAQRHPTAPTTPLLPRSLYQATFLAATVIVTMS